jgi:DNA-binding IclR family transcriptional regulator
MATATRPSAPTLIGSVQRALRLLESVAAHRGGATAKQLAREAGLPLPTTYHLLRTLAHEGYLRREGGAFVLGEAVHRLTGQETLQNRRTKIVESLHRWRDLVGAAVYFAVYRDGEIDLVSVAESPEAPAVEEWADFRATGHAHAIGQCLLSQLDDTARRDHLERYPVFPLTPYSVRDRKTLLDRLVRIERKRLVVERQEYALGTVCAAVPLNLGSVAATMAVSVPLQRERQLLPAVDRLRSAMDTLLTSETSFISI